MNYHHFTIFSQAATIFLRYLQEKFSSRNGA